MQNEVRDSLGFLLRACLAFSLAGCPHVRIRKGLDRRFSTRECFQLGVHRLDEDAR